MYRRAAPRTDPAHPRRTARGGAGSLGAGDFPSFARAQAAPGTVELAQGWKLASALDVPAAGADLSQGGYDDSGWHPVRRMPSTVLETLQRRRRLSRSGRRHQSARRRPADLYRQDWWYRTTFTAPAGHSNYTLQFPGINYRAEIWLNGQLLADSNRIVGMYSRTRPRRHPVDPGRAAEHLGGQGDSRAGAAGRRRRRTRRQLVGLDQLARDRLPGPRGQPGPRHVFRARPQRRHLETGLPQTERRRVARTGRGQHRTALAQNGFRAADDLRRRPQQLGAHRAGCPARDDQPGRQARHPRRTTRDTETGRGSRGPVRPRGVPRAGGVTPRPVVAVHPRRARPLRPEPGIPPVRPRGRRGPPAVRYPHRATVPRRRRAVSRHWAAAAAST